MLVMKNLTSKRLHEMVEEALSMSDEEIYLNFGDKYQTKEPFIDCEKGKNLGCQAKCCYFFFGISPQDVKEGVVQWNEKFPFTIKQRGDGSCIHLNKESLSCEIWKNRPAVCRKYSCKKDDRIGILKNEYKHRKNKI